MKTSMQQREMLKAKEIANEYVKKGFQVILEPSFSDLPEKLKNLNFQPDIIALSKDINLIIEVKTFESIKNRELIKLAEQIKLIDGWDFELIYTNPKVRKNYTESSRLNSDIDVKYGLERAARFLDTDASKEYSDAAMMLIWSAVESALRIIYKSYEPKQNKPIARGLIRDLVILGVIGKDDQTFLEMMMKIRNELSHGISATHIDKKDLKKLIKLGRSVLNHDA